MPLCGPERSACSFRSIDSTVRVSGSGASGDPWRIDTYAGAATESPDTRPALADRFTGMKVWTTDTERLFMWDGTVWRILEEPLQSHTPTLTNLNVGAGTISCHYRRTYREVNIWTRIRLGVGFSFTAGGINGTLPVNADNTMTRWSDGKASIYQASSSFDNFPAAADVHASAPGTWQFYSTNGAFAITSTNPITWAVGDEMRFHLRYGTT